MIISNKEYNELKNDSLKLKALEVSGVDNWSDYSDAMKIYKEWKEEDDNQ